jgi:hypothetical protein
VERYLSAIGTLDESNASLRLLLLLRKVGKPLMLSDLYYEMRKHYGLGRRAVDTAIKTCLELGLIKREEKRIGKNPMPSLFHSLNGFRGKKVAQKIEELVAFLG